MRDSINTVESLVNRAIELGHNVLAITEHETISSAIKAEKVYNKVKKEHPDFKLILGNEIYLCRNGLNAQNFNRENDRYYHFILLAKDAIGHEQIREISTRAWSHSYMARGMMRVPTYYQDLYEVIGRNPGHVIGSTACLGGALPTQLLKYRKNHSKDLYKKICLWCRQLKDLFREGNFYLEMQPSRNEEQIYVNKNLIKLSEELDIPYIITNDSHYLKKEDINIHHAFLNAQGGDRETESFYATTYLMSTEEIYEYMEQTLGEEVLQKAFNNILKIKEKCKDYSLMRSLRIPYLPKHPSEPNEDYYNEFVKEIPVMKSFKNSEYDSDRHLLSVVLNKIKEDSQYQNKRAYDEINICLKSVWDSSEASHTRWSAYLMNVRDYIEIAWEDGDTLIGPSRGSGGGFILLNILGITQINPLREKTKLFPWRLANVA